MATLGIDFGVTRLKTDKYDVKVNIFDLAGQPFFFEVARLATTSICHLFFPLGRFVMSSTKTPKELC